MYSHYRLASVSAQDTRPYYPSADALVLLVQKLRHIRLPSVYTRTHAINYANAIH